MSSIETKTENRCFGGTQGVYCHHSAATGTEMTFAVYLPPGAEKGSTPALFYLSGITCTWENATIKAGAQRYAAEHGIALVFPDTSPRGEGVADSEDWQLGQGAGFYVDATEEPWAPHFSMQRYIVDELYEATIDHFGFDRDRIGIMGHSMGGHGALTLAMRHPEKYRSLSALAAIVAPSRVEWAQQALRAYLGDDRALWQQHDACALVAARGWHGDILLDQGQADSFLEGLRPEWLAEACADAGVELTLRRHEGYDHSYYFVATFIGDHIAWHAKRLGTKS